MQYNNFVISVNGLASGETTFLTVADKEFFVKFENYEILDAALKISLVIDKTIDKLLIDCEITGTITVPCDRCLSPVTLPVSTDAMFCLKLKADAVVEDEYEEVSVPEGSDSLDLSQEIYDYSLLALPLQKVHNEGECDPAALACLSKDEPDENSAATSSPFADLAEMLNKKQK